MKKYIIPSVMMLAGLGLIVSALVTNKPPVKDKPVIIKQTTDNRGLTSVMFTEGKDTFALDYLNRAEYDSIFLNPPASIKSKFLCPDCGEWGCIYEDIDERIIEGTDAEISTAIYQVCKERNITDSIAIAWLKGDYYQ